MFFIQSSFIYFKFKGHSRKNAFFLLQRWNKKIVKTLNVKIEVFGEIPKEKCLVLPNHRSYLDIFIMQSLYPASMVGKIELLKWPVLRLGMKDFYMILVDRSNTRSRGKTMLKIRNELNAGGSIILFPEGTTYRGPLTKDFKTGTFKLAAESNLNIIPVAIEFEDKDDCWIDDDTFVAHFFRQMGKKETKVKVVFGETLKGENYKDLVKTTKDWIDQSLIRLNKV